MQIWNRLQIVRKRARQRQRDAGEQRDQRTHAAHGTQGLLGSAGLGLPKSTVGAVEICFSFSTVKFAFGL